MAIDLNEMTEPIINLYEMAEQLDSAMDCLQKYSNTFKHNKEICEKLLLKDLYAQEHEYTDFITEINSQYISIWETTQIFFKLLGGLTICAVGGNPTEADKLKHEVFKKTAWIGCDRIGDSLFVKLPWLPLKKRYKCTLYQNELRHELELLEKSKGLPMLYQKRIHFVSVYKSYTSLLKIPDNDNYDAKRIIDILTDYVGGGDGGTVCSIYMETILNDEIPEGTYIIVSPESAEFKKGEARVEEFKLLVDAIKSSA